MSIVPTNTYRSTMYMSTDRRDLTDPDKISEETAFVEVDVQDSEGSIKKELSENEFLGPLVGRNVIIYVHGYNMDMEQTASVYNVLRAFTGGPYGAAIGHMWPGGDKAIEYGLARRRVKKVLDDRFADTLRKIQSVAANVDILAHSMGCRLALETLSENDDLQVRNLHLVAAAVDNEKLEFRRDYNDATNQCERVFVYHSENDRILKYAYPIVDWDRALGYKGAQRPHRLPANVVQIDMTDYVDSHVGYFGNFTFAKFIRDIAEQGARPIPLLRGIETAA